MRESVAEKLARRGLAAHRARGQNFLVDPKVAAGIAERAGIGPDEAVIEIGPGLGVLTRALAARARRVVAVEIDAGLWRSLVEEGELPDTVEVIHADALEIDLDALARRVGPPVKVVASLPYSISSPLLRRLLDLRARLRDWVVLVQHEVALRMSAGVGSRDYGSLAVLHQLCTRVERLRSLPPHCFHPAPSVTSTLVRVTPLEPARLGGDELVWVERVVRAAFGQRRKMLTNALRAGLDRSPSVEVLHGILDRLGIDRRARAEALEPTQLLELARALRSEPKAS